MLFLVGCRYYSLNVGVGAGDAENYFTGVLCSPHCYILPCAHLDAFGEVFFSHRIFGGSETSTLLNPQWIGIKVGILKLVVLLGSAFATTKNILMKAGRKHRII